MNSLASRSDQCASPRELRAPAQQGFLTIPTRLVVDLHDTPLAVGLYSLIARQYVITKAPVPLSTSDVICYDPSLSRGAVLRALARLVAGGWVVASQRHGHKTHYTPGWGRVLGDPRPWQIGSPLMGRPRRLIVLRLDQRLLDICMGKITPHPLRTALIERYFTRPLIGLADVGVYVLALAGYSATTAPLRRLALVRDGQAQPLPADRHVLALASQRALEDGDAATLTERGLRRIGCVPAPLAGASNLEAQPLFFVPQPMIGMLIGTMIDPLIGHPDPEVTSISASASDEAEAAHACDRSHGLQGDEGLKVIPPPTPPVAGGGGGKKSDRLELQARARRTRDRGQERRRRQQPSCASTGSIAATADTETAQALSAINVLPAQVAELAGLPIELTQAAIRDGQARPEVRDLAGWVVHLLRNARDHGWSIQPPMPRPDSPEALRAAFARYAADQEAAHETTQEASTCLWEEQPSPAPCDLRNALPRLWDEILRELQLQLPRREFNSWLRCCELQAIENGVAILSAPNVLVKETVESRYLRTLRDLLGMQTGLELTVRVVLHGARPASDGKAGELDTLPANGAWAGAPAREATEDRPPASVAYRTDETEGRPVWISAEQWASLPMLVRAALRGATLKEGEVCAASPHLDRLLHTRYQHHVDSLLIARVGSQESESAAQAQPEA